MMLSASLPPEILADILELLPLNNLLDICLISSTYRLAANRILYRDIVVEFSPQKTIHLLRLLSSNDTLATHVRRFRLTNTRRYTYGINRPLGRYPLLNTRVLLKRCLGALHYLTSLRVHFEDSCSPDLDICSFQICKLFIAAQPNLALATFLNKQAQLRELVITHASYVPTNMMKIDPTSLPHLSILRAPLALIPVLVPGRPLTLVDIQCGMNDRSLYSNAIPSLARATTRVLRVCISGFKILAHQIFKLLALHTPHLLELQLFSTMQKVVKLPLRLST
jgi:hypothetical protein